MTTNGFGKYFGFKLKKRRAQLFVFAVLNFLTTILPAIIFKNMISGMREYANRNFDGEHSDVSYEFFIMIMFLSVAISVIMIIVTTARSLKLYYNRPAMDTLCSLPVSYSQRFWGDFLSGLFVNFITYIPFFGISLLITLSAKSDVEYLAGLKESIRFSNYEPLMYLLIKVIIMIIIVYLGVYVMTTFVSSACGKLSSSIVFSVILMVVLPGIFISYADFFYSFVIGTEYTKEIMSAIGMLPPFGPLVALKMDFEQNYFGAETLIDQPICLIINLVLTVSFAVGAYFIGKYRKAERVGQGFVYESVHQVLSLTLSVMLIGAFSFKYNSEEGVVGIFLIALFSFLVYGALELAQKKSFKGFGITVLKFVGTFAVCFAFLTAIKNTNAFNYSKKLPNESSVKEIVVSGEYFARETCYRADESIKGVFEEHKKLLDEPSLSTGSGYDGEGLTIQYILNSGKVFQRNYNAPKTDTGDPIRDFTRNVQKLKSSDMGSYGLMESKDFTNIRAKFDLRPTDYDENGKAVYPNFPQGNILPEKTEELAKLLRYDLENNYNANDGRYNSEIKTLGEVDFSRIDGEEFEAWDNYFNIYETYEKTVEFLKNPDNYGDSQPDVNSEKNYFVSCKTVDNSIRLVISENLTSNSDNANVKEFLKYIEMRENGKDELYSELFRIHDLNNQFVEYGIRKENEKAAIEAFIKCHNELSVQ